MSGYELRPAPADRRAERLVVWLGGRGVAAISVSLLDKPGGRGWLESFGFTPADAELRPGEAVAWRSGPTHVLGLLTTSSSTDGTDHRRARVLALGG